MRHLIYIPITYYQQLHAFSIRQPKDSDFMYMVAQGTGVILSGREYVRKNQGPNCNTDLLFWSFVLLGSRKEILHRADVATCLSSAELGGSTLCAFHTQRGDRLHVGNISRTLFSLLLQLTVVEKGFWQELFYSNSLPL